MDLIVTPMVTILSGSVIAVFFGPAVYVCMYELARRCYYDSDNSASVPDGYLPCGIGWDHSYAAD
nr:hypothetical protein [Treponema vincentii]